MPTHLAQLEQLSSNECAVTLFPVMQKIEHTLILSLGDETSLD